MHDYIGFSLSTTRGSFWKGTDDLLVISPALFDNTEFLLRNIMKKYPAVRVDSNVLDLLNGEKKVSKITPRLLFAFVTLVSVKIPDARKIAVRYNIYAYDAFYVQCCIENKLPLISLDTRMCAVAKNLGIKVVE